MPREKKTTARKKTSAPKSVASSKVASEAATNEDTVDTTASKQKTPNFHIKRSHLLVFIAVVSLVVLLYLFRGLFVVAMVNGEPITRLSVISELEAQGGAQVTDSLVTQKLIRQDAREKGITVTEEEINEEIQVVEELYEQQGQDLEQVLSLRGMTRADMVEQIELKVLLDKLVGEVEVTDEEVQEFIEQNNETYGGTLTEEDVRAQLEEQKFSEQSSEYITNLQEQADINYFIEY